MIDLTACAQKIGFSVAAIAMIGGISMGSAGAASAAHCTDAGGAGTSDFAAHVKASKDAGGHNEGDHRGWSSCQETSPNYVE